MTRIMPSRPPVQKPAKANRNPAHMARDRIKELEAEREAVVPLLEEVRGILSHYTGSTAAQDDADCLEYKRDMACLDRVEWMIAQITGIPR